jgi:hypothetical protein
VIFGWVGGMGMNDCGVWAPLWMSHHELFVRVTCACICTGIDGEVAEIALCSLVSAAGRAITITNWPYSFASRPGFRFFRVAPGMPREWLSGCESGPGREAVQFYTALRDGGPTPHSAVEDQFASAHGTWELRTRQVCFGYKVSCCLQA